MAFCTNCGQQVDGGAKFCANCGTPISQNVANTERKIVFDGEIHKCPHCGEVLKAFEIVCPSCKFELRGAKSSSAIRELENKLELAGSDAQKINIIKNFPIPNTKEDIFEFMVLASSNFDATYYASHLNEEDISDAWLSKIEQCYKKAKLLLSNMDFEKLESIYLEIESRIKKTSINKKLLNLFFIASICIGILLTIIEIELISSIGVILLIGGIVGLVVTKKAVNSDKNNKNKKGFSSWSGIAKFGWIVLNVYTIGIPAIIYSCTRKK